MMDLSEGGGGYVATLQGKSFLICFLLFCDKIILNTPVGSEIVSLSIKTKLRSQGQCCRFKPHNTKIVFPISVIVEYLEKNTCIIFTLN